MKNYEITSWKVLPSICKFMRCTFCEYFPPPDESKNWIKDPFNVDTDKLKGLTAAEEMA
jgi:hypothetical protein